MELSSPKESTLTSLIRNTSKKPRRISSLLRRISTEFSTFVQKVKALSESTYPEDAVEDLFESSDDDVFERFLRGGVVKHTAAETQFLLDYKTYKSLDKLHEAKDPAPDRACVSVDDLDSAKVTYRDLDVVKLRDDLETRVKTVQLLLDTSTDLSMRGSDLGAKYNVGEALWELRRNKWLSCADDNVAARLEERSTQLSIKHIPREAYPRIYTALVERGRPLRPGKHMNLEDLINVINAGWTRDERWERAARGVA